MINSNNKVNIINIPTVKEPNYNQKNKTHAKLDISVKRCRPAFLQKTSATSRTPPKRKSLSAVLT